MATTTTSPTPSVVEAKMYVAVDPKNNNNKFWKYERFAAPITSTNLKGQTETGDLKITWGRVGATTVDSQVRMYDADWLEKKVAEKLRGKKDETGRRVAYTEVQVLSGTDAAPVASSNPANITKEQVKKIAVKEIAGGCPVTAALVKKLAEANRHELIKATGGIAKGGMDIDLETGLVRTALGVVTSDNVKDARQLLDQMAPFVSKSDTDNPKYLDLISKYLRLVPQDTGRRAGWHRTFIVVQAQSALLDQLEASIEMAEQRMQDAINNANGDKKVAKKQPQVFDVKLKVVTDEALISRIKRMYEVTASSKHEAARLKPVRVYEVEIPHMAKAFEADGKKVGNVKLLWHGTRMFNVLSILKRGFVLPHQLSTVQTTGAMYGPGLYFSAMSTKSLNYSYGYWDGGRRDSNCYMFLVDVAMGKEYIPQYSGNGKKAGYDSCWAKPGVSGVINDEQIVYRTSQANIRYLVEFDSK